MISRSRLSKLRAMPLGEIAGRMCARAAGATEKLQHRLGLLRGSTLAAGLPRELRASSDWPAALLELRRHSAVRFFPGLRDQQEIRRLFQTEYQEEWRRGQEAAAAARRGACRFFGQTFTLGPVFDWHADPVSRCRWPTRWHADIPVGAGDVGFGDVKYVWEASRHQFLIDLGKAYWLAGDPLDAGEVRAVVASWIAQNPYGVGVNWASPLEPAYRSLSWLWAYYFCLADPALDPETHARWLAGFHDHGRFLHRHLELYASPFNHLIGEAAALYMLGVLFPEFHEAAAWRRRGRRVLESRLRRQFYADGGSVEQATFYHHATLGFYLLAALLGRANGEEFSPAVWQAIERAIEFSMYVRQPDGRVPAIGDTDDAKPIRLEDRPFWDFRAFQAMGAVLYGRADFKHAAGRFHEDALWLLGVEGRDRFTKLQAVPPVETSKALHSSGYYILRTDWSDRADYVCFDCGEQAAGLRRDEVPSAAHGHADCLSVTMFLGGRPALVDSGFFTYNGAHDWERHFRETAAHNTARIDFRDQAKHVAKMAWCEAAEPRLERWMVDGRQGRVVGSHDGYARSSAGIVHRRTVWLRPGGYVVLYDEFVGEGEHQIEINLQMPPSEAAVVKDGLIETDDRIGICWAGHAPVTATLCAGGANPDEGWIATSLGVRAAAPRLSLSTKMQFPRCGILTVVADLARVGRIVRAPRSETASLSMTVTGADFVDWILAGAGGATAAGPFETDASLAVWRLNAERIVETARIGGSYLRPIEGSVAVQERQVEAAARMAAGRLAWGR